MLRNDDHWSLNTVLWEWSWRKSVNQLYTWSGRSSCASFCSRVKCRTVSNAFEKSNDRTMTYGSVVSRLMTVFIREMMAAVGEPVGRKANWSWNCSVGKVYRTIFMLANEQHRTVTITIITNCTRFTKPRYIILKIDLYKDNSCSTLICILVCVLITFVVNVIIAYRMVSRTQSKLQQLHVSSIQF